MSAPWEDDPGLWIGWGVPSAGGIYLSLGSAMAPWQVINQGVTDGFGPESDTYQLALRAGVDLLRSQPQHHNATLTFECTKRPASGGAAQTFAVDLTNMSVMGLSYAVDGDAQGVYEIRGFDGEVASKNKLIVVIGDREHHYDAVAWYSDPGGVVPPGPEPEPAAFWTAFVLTKEQVSHA